MPTLLMDSPICFNQKNICVLLCAMKLLKFPLWIMSTESFPKTSTRWQRFWFSFICLPGILCNYSRIYDFTKQLYNWIINCYIIYSSVTFKIEPGSMFNELNLIIKVCCSQGIIFFVPSCDKSAWLSLRSSCEIT